MKPHPIASALVLLAATVAAGQAPSAVVVGPAKGVPVGGAVVLDASASVSSVPLVWKVEPPTPILSLDVPPKRLAIFQQPEAGEYLATAMALGLSPDGKPIGDVVTVRFWVLGPGPIPPTPPPSPPPGPPTPDPTPDPDTKPPVPVVVGRIFATLFYDINDNTVGSLRESKALADELNRLDCVWYKLATTAPAAQPFAAEIAATGSPVVLFQSADWSFVKGADGKPAALKAPKSAADVIARVREMRGVAK